MQRYKLDSERSELLERIPKLTKTPSKPVIAVNSDNVKPPPASIGHQPIQLWSRILRSRNAHIHVLARNMPAAAFTILLHFAGL
jgi:hypothetical protein